MSDTTTVSHLPPALPPLVIRGLTDKLYEKRKVASLEVERFVRELINDAHRSQTTDIAGQPLPTIVTLIKFLFEELVTNASFNSRNGGLIGLAGIAIALSPEHVPPYVTSLVPPVLACFNDTDYRVRYYACESLYNISKVARAHVLPYFPQMFDALSKLFADTETNVNSGARLLDLLLKDIITEQKSTHISTFTLFSLPNFFTLLKERIHTLNLHTRSFIVSWLAVLDTVPGVELVSSIDIFLPGLFKFLTDENEDLRVVTSNLLAELLREISEAVDVQRRLGIGFGALERDIYGHALDRIDLGMREAEAGNWVPAQYVHLDFPRMFKILLPFLETYPAFTNTVRTTYNNPNNDDPGQSTGTQPFGPHLQSSNNATSYPVHLNGLASPVVHGNFPITTNLSNNPNPWQEIRVICLQWINEFILLSRQIMLPYTPDILRQVLPAIASPDATLQATAATTNSILFTLIDESDLNTATQHDLVKLDFTLTLREILNLCDNTAFETRKGCLGWLLMLHKKSPMFVLGFPNLLPGVFRLLSDPSEDVVKRALRLVAQISSFSEGHQFDLLMADILLLFARDRKLLESRGSLIVRQLCIALSPEDVFRSFAQVLEREADLEFASTMITNLNLILITSVELADMRRLLRSFGRDGQRLFVDLYRSWCHSAVSTLSLCLLAEAYEHGFNLLQTFEDLEITVTLLVQIDKLVQLLESPVFSYLRLQLLEPNRHAYLYKFLYGVLMLLPQSSAFATLRNRLTCVSTLGYMHVLSGCDGQNSGGNTDKRINSDVKWPDLLLHFKNVQIGHERARKAFYNASRYSGTQRRALRVTSTATPTSTVPNATQPNPIFEENASGQSTSGARIPNERMEATDIITATTPTSSNGRVHLQSNPTATLGLGLSDVKL